MDLLVELSSVVAVDERGEDYLLEHPDLVVGLGDPEALRRLFEAKTGWPGTRHARLAIAYTTDGDTPEAYNHARRADEWLRWLHRQDQNARIDVKATIAEYAATPFFAVARGQTTHAALHIDQWNDAYGYRVASKLFQFCSVSAALGNLPNLKRVIKTIVRCRAASPPIIASALNAFPSMDPSSSTRLLGRLARALPTSSSLQEHYLGYEKSDSYQIALLRSAIRAAHLSLCSEANVVLEFLGIKRFAFWALRDSHSTEQLLAWVLVAVTRAVIECRKPMLFDCVPEEFWQLVFSDASATSESDQLDLLERRIREEPHDEDKREDKKGLSGLSSSERYHATEMLRTRVLPLFNLACQLSLLVRAKGEDEQRDALTAFFEGWKSAQTVAQKGMYHSNEQKRYLDNLYSASTLHTLTALGLFTPVAATAVADWVRRSEYVNPRLCIDFIAHFASREDCHEQAGRMATEAVKAIEKENDVAERSDLFARLARALLAGNRAEAVFLFSRGLSELDAIGSGDYAFTSELLAFATTLAPASVQPEAALRLAKICELNIHDSDKFPWPLTAHAFSRVWGGPCLAQFSRWHDREKADMELTLPAALSFLLRDRLIPAEDAVGLLSLVKPVEMWTWGWEHIVEALITAEPKNLAFLLDQVLDQFERACPERPRTTTLKEIREVLQKYPAALAHVETRIDRLEARALQPRQTKRKSHRPVDEPLYDKAEFERNESEKEREIEEVGKDIDATSVVAVESLIDRLDDIDGALDVKLRVFSILRSEVKYADQIRHIEAIVSARNLRLFAKTALIKAARDEWLASSPSQLAVLRGVGIRIVRDQATELTGKKWGFEGDLYELAEVTGDDRGKLAMALIEAATSRDLSMTARAWLSLATILAERADPPVPRRALERLLDSGAARLADEVGDGPWRPELEAANDSVEIAAGLVWFCLGSPEVTNRWRAAHTVRTFARLGRWDVLEKLFAWLDAADAGPFQDRKLPFFVLHAKQWFLLAVARLAIDYPTEIGRYSKILEAIALNDSFPHVALREAARRSLLSCLGSEKTASAKAMRKRLEKVHQSRFPRSKKRIPFDFYGERPQDVPAPEPRFHFDYDFAKYHISDLGEMFGLPRWSIEDRCARWIRTWDATIESMYDFGGRPHSGGHYGYYSGTQDSFHSYGTYLAEHALALAGGELLLESAVTGHSYKDDPLGDWLADYSPTRCDGLWLADGTGRYPDYALNDLLAAEEEGTPSADVELLFSLATAGTTKRIGERLVIYGSWESPDRVTVSITSVLIPRRETATAAVALATGPVFHMWLPVLEQHEEEEDDIWRRRESMAPCEPWITTQDAEIKIDNRDPYGSRAALARARPSKHVIDAFKLTVRDPWSESWFDKSRPVIFSRAWGCRSGRDEQEVWDRGTALECERDFLATLLTSRRRDLLLLIKLRHYREQSTRGERRGSGGEFTHSFVVAAIDHTLRIRLFRPSSVQSAAIDTLTEQERHDFRPRFDALRRIANRRGAKRSSTGSRKKTR